MSAEQVVPDDEIGPARPITAKKKDESSGEIGPARPPHADAGDTRPRDENGLELPPPMPARVGGFTVIDALGTGGMGHVYLARQDSLERLVAVKVLRNELGKDKIYLERFQREAKAAALFQHPHVVAVIDTGHDPAADLHYIAFEYIDGGSLEAQVRARGPFPERRALEVTKAVAQALQFAESRRLVHRDLKPANILIGVDGTVKLADLGLVRQAERVGPQVTQEGIILGTPLYMAPEQALGRDIDVRADIYSLGLCLFRMLTGRTPFNESDATCSTLAILSRHVNEELPDVREFVKDVREGVVRVLRDMTARDPEERYRSAAYVAQDLDRLLAGHPPLGARGYLSDDESDAPTTALAALKLEDVQRPAPAPSTVGGAPAPAAAATGPDTPTVAAPAVKPLPPLPAQAASAAADDGARGGLGLAALAAVALAVVVVGVGVVRPPSGEGAVAGASATTPPPVTSDVPPPTPPTRTTEPPASESPPPVATEPAPVDPTTEPLVTDPPEVEPSEVEPADLPPLEEIDPLPPAETPPAETPSGTPRAQEDPIGAAILEARGDPDRLAALVRQISLELFVDVPRGREHLERLIAKGGWAPGPLRDTFVRAMQALLAAFENVEWEERQRHLQDLAYATRQRMSATEIERLKAAVDAELARWYAFAQGAPRVRLALGDPRTEDQALRAFDALPQECFVREDARALLAMARAADQPDRWVRISERREEVRLAVRELRDRLERTALALVLAEETTVVARVLERQLDDVHASLPTAVLRTWAEGTIAVAGQPRSVAQSVFLQARRSEVPRGAPWTNLPGWALAIEDLGPAVEAGGITVTIDEKLTVHLSAAGVVVGGTFKPCGLAGARQVLIEPRFDGLLLRLPGAEPDEIMVNLPEGPVVPVRFSARAQEGEAVRLILVRVPTRQTNDPRSVRGESIRRQRQGR